MEITVTYNIFTLLEDNLQWSAGTCVSAMYVNTDEEEKYSKFCNRVADLLQRGVVVNPHNFGPVKHGDFRLWIEDTEYGFPKPKDCATEEAVRRHVEYCIDIYEAFYVE